MSVKTAEGLVKYAKAQLGRPYWYGTFGQISSASLLKSKRAQYPDYYNQSKYKVKFISQYGQRVHDCAGLIKGFLWSETPTSTPKYNPAQDWGANGMLANHCKEHGAIDTIPETAGVLVFYPGHVGVYIGNGEVIEARGHDYGVVKTKLKDRAWKNWGKLDVIDYSVKKPAEPAKPSTNVPKAGQTVNLKNANLYASAASSIPTKRISGTYYLYDANPSCGRYRITNNPKNANRKPMILYVTGWIDKGAV